MTPTLRGAAAAVILLATTLLGACGDTLDDDCDDERETVVREFGEPDEIRREDRGDFHSWVYWYRARGFTRTFVWGTDVPEDCRITDVRLP